MSVPCFRQSVSNRSRRMSRIILLSPLPEVTELRRYPVLPGMEIVVKAIGTRCTAPLAPQWVVLRPSRGSMRLRRLRASSNAYKEIIQTLRQDRGIKKLYGSCAASLAKALPQLPVKA